MCFPQIWMRGIATVFDPTSVWNVLQWHVLISAQELFQKFCNLSYRAWQTKTGNSFIFCQDFAVDLTGEAPLDSLGHTLHLYCNFATVYTLMYAVSSAKASVCVIEMAATVPFNLNGLWSASASNYTAKAKYQNCKVNAMNRCRHLLLHKLRAVPGL